MTTWEEFAEGAPRIAGIFVRRHAAAGYLCMLATLRSDGYPRISPIEPRVFEGELWLVGMPDTTKFRDLARDPRFCLHTATVDPQVTDGDAKLWGTVHDVRDKDLHQRFAQALFDETGFDLRGQELAVTAPAVPAVTNVSNGTVRARPHMIRSAGTTRNTSDPPSAKTCGRPGHDTAPFNGPVQRGDLTSSPTGHAAWQRCAGDRTFGRVGSLGRTR